MLLDKTLLLKGVAGVAAVGAAGGTYVFREQLGLVSSSSKIDAKGEEERGIPAKCITAGPSKSCELTEEELKKIKFETLEEEGVTGDVTVENFPSSSEGKLTLTIYSIDANDKRYIFNNTSSSKNITIKRGNDASPKTVTLKANGKTKFHLNNKKLKESTVGTYGLPSFCVNSCILTSTDLEEIKFEELNGGTETVTVSPKDKTVTLTIDSSNPKKYKFNNASGSPITIKKGNTGAEKTVTLAAGTSEYREKSDSSVLKFVEPTEANGVPTKCTTAGTDGCQLTEENLKNIKFKVLEEVTTGTVTLDPSSLSSNTITLSISAASGSTPKIYKFKNSGSSAVTLKKGNTGSEKKIVLEKGENDFKDDKGKLVVYEDPTLEEVNKKIVDTLKLPEKCKFKNNEKNNTTKDCEVSVEELKKAEFVNKQESQELNITGISGSNIKLGIRRLKVKDDKSEYESVKDGDLRFIFKDVTSKITISGKAGSDIVIPKNSNKELHIDVSSSKLADPYSQLSSLPQIWKVYCQENDGCTAADSSIRVFNDSNLSNLQDVKVSDSSQKIFDIAKDTDEYNLGYKFTVKKEINGSGGTPTLTKDDTYEIKYAKGKGWGFVKKNGGQ